MKKIILSAVLALLFVSACGGGVKTPDTNSLSTQILATSTPQVTPTPMLHVGSTWVRPADGMTMLYIPAGTFTMGDTLEQAVADCQKYLSYCKPDDLKDEQPPHDVYLDSYWMDKTEVTNAMYALCVKAGVCAPPQDSASSSRYSYYGDSQYDDYPVIWVDWSQANCYCQWAGARLPTEAEWEKAASWDDNRKEKRVYPWGNSIDCSLANYAPSIGQFCKGDTTKVGNYPSGASFYGLLDMTGNVWEWMGDWYDAYPGSTAKNLDFGTKFRALRGGGWHDTILNVRSANRDSYYPPQSGDLLGFRCSRSQ